MVNIILSFLFLISCLGKTDSKKNVTQIETLNAELIADISTNRALVDYKKTSAYNTLSYFNDTHEQSIYHNKEKHKTSEGLYITN